MSKDFSVYTCRFGHIHMIDLDFHTEFPLDIETKP